jgi:hypothetical protein
MKPLRSSCPSSDTIYDCTVIAYGKGISKKFRHIGKCFNVRAIFKTKHTLHGTFMKTGPVRDAQQMKQCVYNIPCDCDCDCDSTHMSLIDCLISQSSMDISPIWAPVITAKSKNYNSIQCRLSGKISVFCVGTIWSIYLSSEDFCFDSSVVQSLIRV